jgi:hypothetical protein
MYIILYNVAVVVLIYTYSHKTFNSREKKYAFYPKNACVWDAKS